MNNPSGSTAAPARRPGRPVASGNGGPSRAAANGAGGSGRQSGVRAAPAGDHQSPSILSMIGFVAASVAITILVFFVIGYILGRLFL